MPSIELKHLLGSLGQELFGCSGLTAAYLYGSVLREDFVPGQSDIDLLLITRTDGGLISQILSNTSELLRKDLDLNIITECEFHMRIHPGWSRHYFFNVKNSGLHIYGEDLLANVTLEELSFTEAHRRLNQITQRSRFVLTNAGKKQEVDFWLRKYQYWVPLCLMEFLALHGTPEYRVKMAQTTFSMRFRDIPQQLKYPYESLAQLQQFLEFLTMWTRDHQDLFNRSTLIGKAEYLPRSSATNISESEVRKHIFVGR